jgi:methylase of polypeptide subunit release factors
MRFNTDRSNRLAFYRVADQYRARPDIPDAVVDWCARQSALAGPARLLEVGAGTGQLTVPLLGSLPQVRVHAVEPGAGRLNRASST